MNNRQYQPHFFSFSSLAGALPESEEVPRKSSNTGQEKRNAEIFRPVSKKLLLWNKISGVKLT